ncbi:MAG TPA: NADH-dependent alcohol dehydrogenase, partial [Clostridiales bacterium]|nr:NADH-dependent alcohol dehydrogenase [Clostridiales bacterium]
ILSHIMETYFSEPNEDNVSDDIMEALMKSVIRNLRAAIRDPKDYTARSNLLWASTMAENRIIKMGKRCDFQCHNMEHQLGAYTDCNHGCGLAVLHPAYYRRIYKEGLPKFVRFAENVWGLSHDGKSKEELARAGIDALENFIKEIGLPATLRELGITDQAMLKEIADSCSISAGSYKKLTHQEILELFNECY